MSKKNIVYTFAGLVAGLATGALLSSKPGKKLCGNLKEELKSDTINKKSVLKHCGDFYKDIKNSYLKLTKSTTKELAKKSNAMIKGNKTNTKKQTKK